MAKGPLWRDPDTGRALSLEQFLAKGAQVERDLEKAQRRRQKTGAALLDARTVRQERARAKSHQRALQELSRQQARLGKLVDQANPPRAEPVIPSGSEWELSIRYTSKKSGNMHIVVRIRRSVSGNFTADEARAVFRQWRRDGSVLIGYELHEIDWSKGGKVYRYEGGRADDAGISAQPIVAVTPLGQMRIGRVRQ